MKKLTTVRNNIAECDMEMLKILKKRFEYCLQIKKKLNLKLTQPEVEIKLKEIWKQHKDEVLSEDFLNDLFILVVNYSKKIQKYN